eukprot:519383-Pelagomonas_calceolata.AAC.9
MAGASPKDTAPPLVSWGRLSRKALIQGREKQHEVGRGAPDHSFSELSLTLLNFTTTHYHAPSR